jgi:hypothetical protein
VTVSQKELQRVKVIENAVAGRAEGRHTAHSPRHLPKNFFHGFRSRAQPLFQHVPASSNTQHQLDRSPRSKPIVSF